jgi:hypothetical protein
MRADTITLGIEEKYTPTEKAEIADKMAAAVAEVETISGEKKVSDAAFNGRLKKADESVSALARQYNKGCEVAQIGCDIRYDVPEVGKKSYVRMDTGEAVEVHDMSWKEKQETLQFNLPTDPNAPLTTQPTDDQVSDVLGAMDTTPETTPDPPIIDPPIPPPEDPQPGADPA